MDNTVIVAIYAPFAVVTFSIFAVNLFRQFNRRDHYYFICLCLSLVCWFASRISGILANSAELAEFLLGCSIVFIGFMPPLLFLCVVTFYRVSFKRSSIIITLFFVIAAINAVVALTAPHHKLMFAQLEIVSLAPVREVLLEWGSWFWIHSSYSYILSVFTIGIILILHFRVPKFYRTPSKMIVVGVLITLSGNVVTLLQVLPLTMDPTLIAMSISLVLFELAIFSNRNSKFVRFSRGEVFQYIHEYILILDESKRVVDYNNLARAWFSERKITLASSLFDDVMAELLSDEKVKKKDFETGDESDIYLDNGASSMVLNLRVKEIIDVRGEKIGSIAIFTDVTRNRQLIEQLEAKAGIDALTGLANRMAYEGAKKRMDSPEFFPLTVVMCDVNGLKCVNDTLGHRYGDMMLQIIADMLAEACPEQCFVARIGGDEFIFLLPNTLPEAALTLTEEIRHILRSGKKTPFVFSTSLGVATKYSADEDLEQIITLADSRMYKDKKNQKKTAIAIADIAAFENVHIRG